MIRTKHLLIFVAVLAVVALTAGFLGKLRTAKTASVVGQPILASQIVAQIAEVEVKDGDSQDTIILRFDNDSKIWRITSYHNAPANLTRVAKLTDDLQASKIQREVTSNPERFPRLGLGERTVIFRASDGNEIYKIQFGKTSDEGGVFVKREGDEAAMEIHPLVFFSARPDEWMAREFLQFKNEDVTSVTIHLPDGTLVEYNRGEDSKWNFTGPPPPEGKEVNLELPETILRQLFSNSFFQHYLKGDEETTAANENSRQLTFTLKDGEKFVLRIARRPAKAAEGEGAAPQPAGPVLIFVESAPEKFLWAEAVKTIVPVSTEALWNSLPADVEALFKSPAAEQNTTDPLESAPLIPPE